MLHCYVSLPEGTPSLMASNPLKMMGVKSSPESPRFQGMKISGEAWKKNFRVFHAVQEWENIFTPKGALRIASPSLQTKIAFNKGNGRSMPSLLFMDFLTVLLMKEIPNNHLLFQ